MGVTSIELGLKPRDWMRSPGKEVQIEGKGFEG